jgi:hypothetical protein
MKEKITCGMTDGVLSAITEQFLDIRALTRDDSPGIGQKDRDTRKILDQTVKNLTMICGNGWPGHTAGTP